MTRTLLRRWRGLPTLVLMGALTLAMASCSSDDATSSSKDPDQDPDRDQIIEITFTGDKVVPSGERVAVEVDQDVTLRVTADTAGEIHVHSEPEQEFTYAEGTTDIQLQLDRPGVVEVESHDLELVIVQLEAS